MGCGGECKIQVYDFDFSDLRVGDPAGKGCAKLSLSDLEADISAEIAKSFDGFPEAPIGPLCGTDCECVPLDKEPEWALWQQRSINVVIDKGPSKTSSDRCGYGVFGTYWICSAILPGICYKKDPSHPRTWKRPKNPKRPKTAPKWFSRLEKVKVGRLVAKKGARKENRSRG